MFGFSKYFSDYNNIFVLIKRITRRKASCVMISKVIFPLHDESIDDMSFLSCDSILIEHAINIFRKYHTICENTQLLYYSALID